MRKSTRQLPEEVKAAKGTLRADRKGSPTKYSLVTSIPLAPDTWPDEMAQHYYGLADELKNKNLLYAEDLDMLQSYVHACWLVRDIRDKMFEYPDYFSKEFATLHLRWERTVAMMDRLGSKFGFNPVDKSKVWAFADWKKKEEGISLDSFIKDVKEIKG